MSSRSESGLPSRMGDMVRAIRRRNGLKAQAHKDLSFMLLLDNAYDRMHLLKTLDTAAFAALVGEALERKRCRARIRVSSIRDGEDETLFVDGVVKIQGHAFRLLAFPRGGAEHLEAVAGKKLSVILLHPDEEPPIQRFGDNVTTVYGNDLLHLVDPTRRGREAFPSSIVKEGRRR